jgi:hypothetical protein
MLRAVIVALVLCACGKKDKEVEKLEPPAAPSAPAPSAQPAVGDDCKRVVDHMVELDKAGREALTGDARIKAEKQVAIVSEAMLKSCGETKWSKVMTDCMLASKTFDEGEACGEHLTQEQKDSWAKAATEAAVRSAAGNDGSAGSAQ